MTTSAEAAVTMEKKPMEQEPLEQAADNSDEAIRQHKAGTFNVDEWVGLGPRMPSKCGEPCGRIVRLVDASDYDLRIGVGEALHQDKPYEAQKMRAELAARKEASCTE